MTRQRRHRYLRCPYPYLALRQNIGLIQKYDEWKDTTRRKVTLRNQGRHIKPIQEADEGMHARAWTSLALPA
jgi:hypothetical protein